MRSNTRCLYRPVLSLFKDYLLSIHLSKKQLVSMAIALLVIVTPVTAQDGEQTPASTNKQGKLCTMGVFPFISAKRLEKVFAPIAAELSQAMECALRFRSASSFESFMNKLGNGEYDVAFVQPFDYVQIARTQGYIPLVARSEGLHAVIVTLKDSEVRNIGDLKGRVIALPPSVAAVSYLAMGMLEKAGLNVPEDVALLHSKNHDSCMHKVLIGKVDACATAATTLRRLEARHHRKLSVIARSEALPNALFVVRGDISHKKYHQLQQKMLNLKLSSSTKKMFTNGEENPFRITDDSEYNIIREYCNKYRAKLQIEEDVQCFIPEATDKFIHLPS